MKPTIKDVAKKANVSVATISRILNNLGGYSEETKQKVLNVIKELGYQRNAIARGLAVKSTRTIGVLVPNVSTIFYAELLNGIEDIAHKNDYSVVICNTGLNGYKTIDYLKTLGEKQVDGIIFTSSEITEEYYNVIKDMNVPCVLLSTLSYRYRLPYVKVDDKLAAYTATQYLIEKGHKIIAMISGTKNDSLAGFPRVQGYMQALDDYGISIDEKLIKYGSFDYESGITCMKELLDEGENFSAVFASSDDMAVGALAVAYKRNIRVPEELSVIGYDNTKVAEMAIPPLTVVAQPLYEMGQKSMEKLFEIINNGKQIESIIMPHHIVERNTVKKLL